MAGMELTIEFDELALNVEMWQQAIDDIVQDAFRKAMTVFVQVAAPLIPIDTGMARASLLNVARAYTDLNLAISGRPRGTYKDPDSNVRFNPKGPDAGQALTTHFFINTGEYYEFNLETAIYHLVLNDNYGVRSNKGVPWRSWETGLRAAERELAKVANNIELDPFRYVTRTRRVIR